MLVNAAATCVSFGPSCFSLRSMAWSTHWRWQTARTAVQECVQKGTETHRISRTVRYTCSACVNLDSVMSTPACSAMVSNTVGCSSPSASDWMAYARP